MAHTHPQPEWSPAETADIPPPREKNASLILLWVIALLAVVAAGLAWYKQRQPASLPLESVAPAVTAPAVVPDDEAASAAARSEKPRAEARRSVASAERAPRSQEPRLMTGNPSPQYPAAALRAGIGGTVMVRAEIDASGQPVDVDVVRRSGNRDLDRAAVQAVRKWRFEPALRNGRAVASTVQVPVDFKPI